MLIRLANQSTDTDGPTARLLMCRRELESTNIQEELNKVEREREKDVTYFLNLQNKTARWDVFLMSLSSISSVTSSISSLSTWWMSQSSTFSSFFKSPEKKKKKQKEIESFYLFYRTRAR